MERAAIYDHLAGLLAYPGEDYRERAAACVPALESKHFEADALLALFARRLADLRLETLQEQYIQSFDMNTKGALEVGWHLFGENYDRGVFLVKMRQEMRRLSLAESTELPDHLSHVLRVLGRLESPAAEEFAHEFVLPALAKMRAGLEGVDSPFGNVLEAIQLVLESWHPRPAVRVRPPELRVLA
jgi:nitrate reductase delta subunit